jgi:hypothetical protein
MKRRWVSIAVIVLATLVGGWMCSLAYPVISRPWALIGPPNIDVVDMQAYHVGLPRFFSGPWVVLARSGDGRLLSTGVFGGSDTEWRWTDVSGGQAWSDFPEISSSYPAQEAFELHIHYQGKVYRVDASGRWQPPGVSGTEFSFNRATDQKISASKASSFRWFPTEVLKLQSAPISWEWVGSDYRFALVRAKGVWIRRSLGTDWLGSVFFAVLGAVGGYGVGRFLTGAGARWMARRGEAGQDVERET